MAQLINPLAAVNEGQQFVDGLFTQHANRQAGRALQQGNYNEAAGALFGNGDLRGGMGVQQYGQEQQAAQRTQEQEQQARQMAFSLQAIKALKGVQSQGGNVVEAYASYAPVFQQLGVPTDQVQQLGQALAANPEGFLTAAEQIVGQQARQLEIQNLGNGYGVAIDKATGAVVNEYKAPQRPMNVGDVLYDPESRDIIFDARKPQYQTIQNTDGSTSVVAIDQPAPIRGGAGGDGSFDSVIGPLLQREGGFVARDGSSGAPANFGINQRANPDVNVRDLTPERAAELYRERYWNPVVQAGVPAEAREAVFDFAVNAGPQRALSAWGQSGGDINAFNQARLEHYRRQPDYAQFGRSWERRVAETTPGTADTRGGARVVAQGENRGANVSILSNQEKTALGLPQNSVYQRDQQGRITQVAGSGSRDTNLNQTDQRRLSASITAAESASSLANDARRFVELNRRAPTNPLVGATGPVAGLNPTYAEMRSIQSRMAPLMREAGSGAMSDRDVALFLRAIPSVGNPTETNIALAGVIQAGAQRSQDRAAFLEDYAQKNGNLLGAQEQWTRYVRANPLFEERGGNTAAKPNVPSWRDFFSGSSGNQPQRQRSGNTPGVRFDLTPAQQQARQRVIGSGGRPSERLGSTRNPYYINPADVTASFANVPRGGYFITPDGQVRGPKP